LKKSSPIFTPGFLPYALPAALCAFKIVPDDFVPLSQIHVGYRVTQCQSIKLVIHANNQTDKLQALLALREHLEELLLLIRLGKEVQAFKSFNSYSQVVELTAKVCYGGR